MKHLLLAIFFLSATFIYSQDNTTDTQAQLDELNKVIMKANQEKAPGKKDNKKKDKSEYTFYDYYARALTAKNNKKYEDGIYYYRKATEADGFEGMSKKTRMYSYFNWAYCLYNIAVNDESIDFHKEAIDKYAIALSIDPDYSLTYNNIGASILDLAVLNKTLEKEKEIIDAYLQKSYLLGEKVYSVYNLTRLYSLLNEKDMAFKWFEKMVRDTDRTRSTIDSYRSLDNLRNDPYDQRYEKLLEKYRK
ncbi:hypothetical protein [Prevotella sp. 10(H)]|uniref:hypothetical protein n=1 Tax=Prevotella sp. 10(H) TaxID=1158294 RepID=UPI0004A6ED47|nr:hypothetical protein [Prevotella sp. 10(H)]